ncbi:hypothetical protein WOLCODRAFT_155370 [Wolfiporia cocos MD-104 SS10]|uniref:Uncharacterized protein n=1 Tax=Wolfiporia cocos (strain MD-104) TaxID=742152 RepID=A0A2H3JAN2_WOLCO|nr:hypothetical protein WOLCODRAFT_155370 [Wolfiporia cocos MD-104 SS10]
MKRRDSSQEDPPQGVPPAKVALPYGGPPLESAGLPLQVWRSACKGGVPLERRLPKPSTYGHGTALTSCVTTSVTAASEHLAHALGTQAPTAKATQADRHPGRKAARDQPATSALPHRTPPPARCHIGGVPPGAATP